MRLSFGLRRRVKRFFPALHRVRQEDHDLPFRLPALEPTPLEPIDIPAEYGEDCSVPSADPTPNTAHGDGLRLYRACSSFAGDPGRGVLGLSRGDLVTLVSEPSDEMWLVRPIRWHWADPAEGLVPSRFLRPIGVDMRSIGRRRDGEVHLSGATYAEEDVVAGGQSVVVDEDLPGDVTLVADDENRVDGALVPKVHRRFRRFSIASIQLHIYRDEWSYVQQVNAGVWGTVYQVRTPGQPSAVHAVKVLNSRWRMSRTLAMTVVEEVAILKQRAKRKAEGGKISPFLLNLAELEDEYHNVWLSPDHRVHILMPLYPGGDLRRYYNYINDIQMQLIIAELLLGLQHLHEYERVIHHDIKPENICVSAQGTVVITDFGAARRMEPGKQTMRTTSEMVLSEAYTAPELAAVFDTASPGQSEYNSLVDMWSLGVTIVALIRGKDFEEGEEIWVRAPVSNARLRMFVSGHALWPDKLWDFLCASDPASIAQGLLESDITKRTNEDYAIWADPYMENLTSDPDLWNRVSQGLLSPFSCEGGGRNPPLKTCPPAGQQLDKVAGVTLQDIFEEHGMNVPIVDHCSLILSPP